MKLILTALLASFCFVKLIAQDQLKPIKYTIAIDSVNVAIEIWPASQIATKTILLIGCKDSLNIFFSDSIFQSFVKQSSKNQSFVKINFEAKSDTVSEKNIAKLANIISKGILPALRKNHPNSITNNFILAGLNTGAIIAIVSACSSLEKINKVAAFFEDYNPIISYNNMIEIVASKMQGKILIHVGQNNNTTQLYSMVNNIALKSTATLYMIDNFEDNISFHILSEAYNWLLADDNNYIIKTE